MGDVSRKLLKLKQKINSVGTSFPMLYLKLDFVDKMELEANSNKIFKKTLHEIDGLADKALRKIEDYDALIEIKNKYSEAYIFSKLQALLFIEKIEESGSKTPDYKVKFRDKNIYIELKSLNMLGGNLKQKEIMSNSMDSKIAAEDQIRRGARVGIGVSVIQPYFKEGKDYDPRSTRLVIEALIDKINQNVKQDQYSLGNTILLVDLADQLLLMSEPSSAIQRQYYDDRDNTNVSGELWHVAFGKVGNKILRPAEFEGAENTDGELQKEGVLISHPYIKGIIFHVSENFYSLSKLTGDNVNVIDFLEYVSAHHFVER